MSNRLIKESNNILRDIDYMFDKLHEEISGLQTQLTEREEDIKALTEKIETLTQQLNQ